MRVVRMQTRWQLLFVLLAMYLAGCVAAVPGGGGGGNGGNGPGNPSGPTVVVQEYPITHSEDHGWAEVRIDSGEVRVAVSPAAIWFGGARRDYDSDAFFRWRNVDIPHGATILEAKMIVWHGTWPAGQSINEKPVQVDIRGFAHNNVPRLRDISDPTTFARTEAKVPWTIEERWSSTESTPHETPDLRKIIQEIVDRPGWQKGNALGVAFDSGAHRTADRYHREICVLDAMVDGCRDSPPPTLFVRFSI